MNKLRTVFLTVAFTCVSAAGSAQGITSFMSGDFGNSSMKMMFSAGEVVSGNFSNSSFNFTGGTFGVTELVATSSQFRDPELPVSFQLYQNYPNPFNPSTTFTYVLPRSAVVTIEIYNSIGSRIASISEGPKSAGVHNIQFNASAYASGLYMYRFIADGVLISTKKMTLIK